MSEEPRIVQPGESARFRVGEHVHTSLGDCLSRPVGTRCFEPLPPPSSRDGQP